MIHICKIISGHCIKVVGEDAVEICRVPLHLWSDENYFEEKYYIYSEKVYEILEELDFAKKVKIIEKDRINNLQTFARREYKWKVDEEFEAGVWHYYCTSKQEGYKFILVIPIIASMLRLATNVQI